MTGSENLTRQSHARDRRPWTPLVRSACPVCGDRRTTRYFSAPYAEGEVRDFLFGYYKLDELYSQSAWREKVGQVEYTLLQCRTCRALFQENCPDDAFATEIYAGWIGRSLAGSAPHYPLHDYTHWISEAMTLTDFVLKRMGKESPRDLRVLDFGMGHGLFARAMAACGCQVWGYDFAENRNMAANDEGGLKMIGLEGIAAAKFDFINTEQVFEHLPEPHATGLLLAESLDDKGLLKISVPFNRWLEKGELLIDWQAGRYARRSSMPLQPLEHLTYFRRPSLNFLAERLRLTQVKLAVGDILRYSIGWTSLRSMVRNTGRALLRDRFRNYYLLEKSASVDADPR